MRLLALAATLVVFPALAPAAVIWNEATNGNLSASQGAPTTFNLAPGTSSIIGTVGGAAGTQDWVAVTIPAGDVLYSFILGSYASADNQGFLGVQAGATFIGSPFSASSYLGYSHFGTSATNGSLPAANLVGVNLLPLMGDTVNVAQGTAGFTPPLSAGTYTFLFQQLSASTSYDFDFGVSAAPEPGILLAALLIPASLRRQRR